VNADPKDYPLLTATLEVAVPLRIMQYRALGVTEIADKEREALVEMIAAHGDDIIYASKKKGGTADAFNALARALALLSFAPGGVTFLGLHWESKP
jgi:hypothetical protein